MISNPLPNCEIFLIGTLRADVNLAAVFASLTPAIESSQVFANQAPESTPYPFIIVSFASSMQSLAMGLNLAVYEKPLYVIKAVTRETDFGTAHRLLRAAEDAVRNANGIASYMGGDVFIQGVRMEAPRIEYTETMTDGERVNHVGNNFRLFVSPVGDD